ncbi:MAG: tRNA (guanosine(37)-N1)-methyltransferase TrmD, partial [Candidatus Paceibacterota bacterium]
MKFEILTIFPEIINDYCNKSILGKAQAKGLIEVAAHNFRDFTLDKHNRVDDSPYGGGPGMVLQVQPIFDCLKKIGAIGSDGKKLFAKGGSASGGKIRIFAMDPAGKKFDQNMAEKFAKKYDRLVFVCGRYEGFDERIYKFVDEKISVGDYVLAGGELPALTIIEAVSRLIPGVLGNKDSLKDETHNQLKIENYKLKIAAEYPQYTRPEDFRGL